MTQAELDRIIQTPMFFIVGRPRTGSTLLRTLFDAHPNVTIPQEWPMILALYKRFGHVTTWNRELLLEFYEALFQKLRIPYWEITNWPDLNKEKLKSSILSCEGKHSFETLVKVVYSQYSSYFLKENILLIGDKNPVYSNQTELLTQIFPNAKFIHLTRDYRDNLVSMLDVDFEMPNIALLSYRWKYSWKVIESVAVQHPGRFFTIRYEDLVDNAEGRFRELCEFLGIPFNQTIFHFHEKRELIEKTFSKEIIERYFKTLFQPIDSSRVGVYRKKLSVLQIRVADLVVGSIADEAGYPREYKRFNIGIFLWSFPAIIYAKWLYTVGWMVGLLPYRFMMWLLNKPSLLVKIYTQWVKR
ncbi:MAG: sulfotransferase [Bacteroidales bacterium]|nr:sulfotransferase [Bacteroidales bacterium]